MGRDSFRDCFGDAVYAAWVSGGDPDSVDPDRIRDYIDDGCDRFECADREAHRQAQIRRHLREDYDSPDRLYERRESAALGDEEEK